MRIGQIMPAQKFERKHFFINRRLQGRYMLTFLIPMLVMLVFMVGTMYFATQSLINTSAGIVQSSIQDKINAKFQDRETPGVAEYEALLTDIKIYLLDFSRNAEYRKTILSSLVSVFGIGLLLVIAQIVLLTIFFSHKLAGPIYRFEIVAQNMIDGKYTDKIILRKGDEMVNLSDLLNEAVVQTNSRFTALAAAKTDEERKQIITRLEL